MKIDLKHLRALCDAATDGEWLADLGGHTQKSSGIKYWQINAGNHAVCCNQFCAAEESKANARFIAATDPQTVRALIDEIERVTKQRNILRRWMIKQRCYKATYTTNRLEQALGENDGTI